MRGFSAPRLLRCAVFRKDKDKDRPNKAWRKEEKRLERKARERAAAEAATPSVPVRGSAPLPAGSVLQTLYSFQREQAAVG